MRRIPSVNPSEHVSGLSVKAQKAVEFYVIHGNKAAAYIHAYGRGKGKRNSFDVKVSEFFGQPKVAAYETYLRDEASKRCIATKESILQRLEMLAFADLPGIVDFDGIEMTGTQFAQLTTQQRACIKSYEYMRKPVEEITDADGNIIERIPGEAKIKVQLKDDLRALEMLGQEKFGMFQKKPMQAIVDRPVIVMQGMPAPPGK